MQACPRCARARTPAFPCCGGCGLRLDAGVAPERTIVATVLTSDLQGSTALGDRLDPERLREVLDRYVDAMRLTIEAHGGSVEKVIGDAIVAVFGLVASSDPGTPGDRAPLAAVRAALDAAGALAALDDRLEAGWGVRLVNRTGIATGPLTLRPDAGDERLLVDEVVERSGRLEQGAPPLETLLDEATRAAVERLAPLTVEPSEALAVDGSPIPAYRLLAVGPVREEGAAATVAVAADATAAHDLRSCRRCGRGSPDDFLHCGGCGRPLVAPEALPARRIVTIVFAALDLRDATGDPLPVPARRLVLERAFERCRTALERHGATVEKFVGDAVMGVLGLPVRREDDALRAIRAALDLRAGLDTLATALRAESGTGLAVAIGVHTGEAITGDAALAQRLVTGDAVNVAARLESAAAPGEILVGDLAARLVRSEARLVPVAPLRLKGKPEPVPAHRLEGLRGPDEAALRPASPLAGRVGELAALGAALERATTDRAPRVMTIVGEAGVGKSRLVHEFLVAARAQGAHVTGGRCLAYGDGITFWPVAELVRTSAGIRESETPPEAIERIRTLVGDDPVAERLAAAIGLTPEPFAIGELFWAIRRTLAGLAASGPLVVVLDDLQWAEETFLDLIDDLAARLEQAPVLVLCLARGELLERRPDWGAAHGADPLVLGPLGPDDVERIVGDLLGGSGIPDAVRRRIVAAAEGNPLFVEQLVAMLEETGSLRAVDGGWEAAGDPGALALPPTIHALLAARLDRLPADEREVVDPASVIGVRFATAALESIVEPELRPAVPVRLSALAARGLIRAAEGAEEAAGTSVDGPEHRFGHQMIRDAAYAGLLKRTRARLHERFVHWADATNRTVGREAEFEEILGYHLEQAHRALADLGPLDAHGVALGVDAAARLGSSGRRAFARGDLPATVHLLARAVALLPDGDPARPGLRFDLGLAQRETGERPAAAATFATAAEEAAALGATGLAAIGRLEALMTRYWADPTSIEEDVEAAVAATIGAAEGALVPGALGRAWQNRAGLRVTAARWGEAALAVERVIRHARRAGDRLLEVRAGPNLALCALLGPTPVPEAIRLTEDVIAGLGGDRKAEAVALRSLAHLHALVGETEAARAGYRRSRAILEELGWRFHAALTSLDSGPIELLGGDPAAAEAELRRDLAALEALGDRNYAATVAAFLADALERQGKVDEAAATVVSASELADPDDVATQVALRAVRARLLVREGRAAEAEPLCREAVELSETEDDPLDRATALTALAEALRGAGREEEALVAGATALALCEAKGATVPAAELRRAGFG